MFLFNLLIIIEIFIFAQGNGELYHHHLEDEDRNSQDADDFYIFRLSKDIRPESYKILIQTDIDKSNSEFSGKVNIIFNANLFCVLFMHAKNLKINESYLWNLNANASASSVVNIQNISDEIDGVIEISLEGCHKGKFRLELEYKGVLRDDFFGFYKTSYTNANGKTV